MGLDMYLTKRIYIGAEYEHRKVTGKISLKQNGKPIAVKLERVTYIEERVGYWRKANQIHNWFVKNVQGGVDNCSAYDVSEEQLMELLTICKEIKDKCSLTPGKVANGYTFSDKGARIPILEDGQLMQNSHIAAKLLPSASGFFFGSTDYDEYYLSDITDTIEIIETLMKEKGNDEYINGDITYRSSW
jgi:hypothetical protein